MGQVSHLYPKETEREYKYYKGAGKTLAVLRRNRGEMGVVNKPSNEGTYTINTLRRHMAAIRGHTKTDPIHDILDIKKQQLP